MNPNRLLNKGYVSLFFINLVVAVSFSMVTTTLPLHLKAVGTDLALIGTLVGCMSVASMCVRPFSGIISDRVRKRNLLQLSLLLIVAAMTGYSLTADVRLMVIFRILHGIGFSFATTVTLALAADTIPAEKMTQGMGYFAIGQTIANAVAPGMGMAIGERFGYEIGFRAAALLLAFAASVSFLFVAPSPRPERRPVRSLRFSDFFAARALPFGLLSIAVAGSTGVENGFVALMGTEAGLGNIGWYFTLSAAALLVSRLLIGRIADRNPRLVIFAGTMSIALAFVLLWVSRAVSAASPAGFFAAAAVLKALGLGAVQPALQSASMRSVDREHRGAASCTYYLGTDVGQAAGPIFGGAAAGAFGYAGMFGLAALPLTIGGIAFTCYFTFRRKDGI